MIGTVAAAQESIDSPEPVLITESNSTRALAINTERWTGSLPIRSSLNLYPSARITVFVANIDLLPSEGANAFRVLAKDSTGKQFRFMVENIRRIAKRPTVHALTFRVFDSSGHFGQPDLARDVVVRIAWRGNASNRARLSKGKSRLPDADGLMPMSIETIRESKAASRVGPAGDRKRFMDQASFGPTAALDFRIRQLGFSRWIEDQFHLPYPTIPYPNLPQLSANAQIGCGGPYGQSAEINNCYLNFYWAYRNQNWFMREALYGEDQLRRRVAWALHQIWVVSENTLYQQRWMQAYIETLDRHAFGNYRDLMRDMTLSPGMGEYLDMLRSTSMNPNENYPRELLQLFTIGLDKLNQDGTLVLDEEGNRIPTYDQGTIEQFTKVFTGWTRCDNGLLPECPNAVVGAPNYVDPMYLSVPGDNDRSAKTLLSYPGAPHQLIAACTNCTTDALRRAYANQTLEQALDNVFHHPNVGPFVGKLLIQHLVTSDPTPAYVGRVAAAFNDNGNGVRGDMKAVIKAILLDPEARGNRKTDPTYGKLKEPVVYFLNFLRSFNAQAGKYSDDGIASPPTACEGKSDGIFAGFIKDAGQEVWYPPNVFSYYSPFAVVPGGAVLGPEFALANTASSFAKNNIMFQFIMNNGLGFDRPTESAPYPWKPCGTAINLSEVEGWAAADATGNTLVESLNTRMLHGTMSAEMKQKLLAAINFDLPPNFKARQALYLVATSSQYQVQR